MIYYVRINDKEYEVEVEQGKAEVMNINTLTPSAPVAPAPQAQAPAAPATPVNTQGGEPIVAPMPGTILSLGVQAGTKVKAGDILVVLEAMKMENEIMAPREGTVTQVMVNKGSTVATGEVLVYLA